MDYSPLESMKTRFATIFLKQVSSTLPGEGNANPHVPYRFPEQLDFMISDWKVKGEL